MMLNESPVYPVGDPTVMAYVPWDDIKLALTIVAVLAFVAGLAIGSMDKQKVKGWLKRG